MKRNYSNLEKAEQAVLDIDGDHYEKELSSLIHHDQASHFKEFGFMGRNNWEW